MIYLIDDKKERQEKDYSWTSSKFEKYREVLTPIYNLEELQENNTTIFNEATVILYHESFIDKSILKNEAAEKRNELESYANKKGKYLVYFSGGSDTRSLQDNIGNLPDFILYQNLEVFLNNYKKGDMNLEYLLYGNDPKIEQKLKSEIAKRLLATENENAMEVRGSQNLFLRPTDDFISTPIINSDNKILWETSDEYLNKFVKDELNEKHYNNIFIPLCFGDTMSDFNGLKLAIHIRCSETLNQNSNISIYGFVKINFLINHIYFDVLKTKNVNLIGFSKQDIYNIASLNFNELTKEEIPQEILKIKLNPPKSYNDNHSLVNEWAIYRWAKAIDATDDYIHDSDDYFGRIENKIESNIFFKYLKTIYPIRHSEVLNINQLQISTPEKAKILYIDDEAEKGWNEVLATLLYDINKLDFDSLDIDYKNINQVDLINQVIKKVKEDDINLVILDFRLISQDFIIEEINQITGVKILKAIKELNPGIQVIMFSATNKIWNLQTLQSEFSDGFIMKESPENSIDSNFTKNSVLRMLEAITYCIDRIFLKEIFIKLTKVNVQLSAQPYEVDTIYEVLILNLKSQINIITEACKKINLKDNSSMDMVFLSCFNILELFKNHYLSYNNYTPVLGINEIEMSRYYVSNDRLENDGKYIRNNTREDPSLFQTLAGIFNDYFFNSENVDSEIMNLHKMKTDRNNYIHGTKGSFDQHDLLTILDLIVKITNGMKE